jgi:hypothetical protein
MTREAKSVDDHAVSRVGRGPGNTVLDAHRGQDTGNAGLATPSELFLSALSPTVRTSHYHLLYEQTIGLLLHVSRTAYGLFVLYS